MTHTPGPWTYDYRTGYVDSAKGTVAYDLATDDDGTLIAAAPDLLAALESILATDPDGLKRPAARAAIAKATGGTG